MLSSGYLRDTGLQENVVRSMYWSKMPQSKVAGYSVLWAIRMKAGPTSLSMLTNTDSKMCFLKWTHQMMMEVLKMSPLKA